MQELCQLETRAFLRRCRVERPKRPPSSFFDDRGRRKAAAHSLRHAELATAPWLASAAASGGIRHLGSGKDLKSLAAALACFVRTRPHD